MLVDVRLENKRGKRHIAGMEKKGTRLRADVSTMAFLDSTPRRSGWFARLTASLLAYEPRPHGRFLDTRGLSDHLKRDMGFLDGSGDINKRR